MRWHHCCASWIGPEHHRYPSSWAACHCTVLVMPSTCTTKFLAFPSLTLCGLVCAMLVIAGRKKDYAWPRNYWQRHAHSYRESTSPHPMLAMILSTPLRECCGYNKPSERPFTP